MRQLWLPAVSPEVTPSCPVRTGQVIEASQLTRDDLTRQLLPPGEPRTGKPPARVVAASRPLRAPVCEAPGGAGAAGTQGARQERRVTANPIAVVLRPRPTPAELAELDALIARLEWAADGGDGSICSTSEPDDVQAINLEWILHGSLLEAMAAVLMKCGPARPSALEQSENSRGAAA